MVAGMKDDARYGNRPEAVARRAGVRGDDGAWLRPGQAPLRAEQSRIADLLERALPPVSASPHIVAAPARGVARVAPQFVTVMTDAGPRQRRDTAEGFHPVACVDAFDRMALRARGRGDGAALFTVAQVEAGRAYAALAERVAAEGVRCASGEAMGKASGRGGGRDWIDGVIARSDRLRRMQAAIPVAVVLAPSGAMAHGDRAQGQRVLRVREVVDAVCLQGRVLTDVLRRAGWPVQTRHRDVLMAGLQQGLDALYGL
jgi:hypothetical protein